MKALAGVLFVLALCACAHSPQQNAQRSVVARRIVSLMPSLTEDLCAIGAGRQIVGVSQYSTDIPCVKGVTAVGNFASVDAERIVRLHPDAVVGIPSQRLMTENVRRTGIPTVFFADDTFNDLFSDIAQLGSLSGRDAQARQLAESLRRRTGALRASERFRRHPSVFFVEQAQPIWTVGPQSYISELIVMAGGRNAVRSLPQAYAQYSPETLVSLQPDAIVATNDAHLDLVLDREPWRSLRAVREGHVFVLQDEAILVRPGPRYNQGLQWLIERLRPLAT